ncbi:MAG: hypothetical protein RLZZ299_2212 [Pseudomonadota bacterium]
MTEGLPAGPAARAWQRLATQVDTRSCELVALDGRLDGARLEAALDHVVAQHPLLHVRWDRTRWATPDAPLRVTPEEHDAPWDTSACAARAWEDGDPDATQVRWIRARDRDGLAIQVPHARTDARSGAQVVADLAEAYGALGRGTTPVRRADDAPWEPEVLLPTRAGERVAALRRILSDLAAPAAWTRDPTLPRGRSRVRVLDLGPAAWGRVKARAAADGTTPHVRLCLATARAFGTSRLLDLASVRGLATADVGARADVLVVPWVLHVPGAGHAHDAAATVAAQVATVKEGVARAELARLGLYESVADWIPVELAIRATTRLVVKADVVHTNPGPVHVPLDTFGDLRVTDFVNFPRLVPPARAGVVWTTFRGRLRMIALWDDGAWPDGIDAPCAAIREDLGLAGIG